MVENGKIHTCRNNKKINKYSQMLLAFYSLFYGRFEFELI